MNASQFVAKWRQVQLTERSAAQQHFLDLCELVDHPKPADIDPKGNFFTFERGVSKRTGGQGWADVWKKGFFAFEYKGKHKDLNAAFDQLLLYRGSLENPPLLVACDMDRLIVRTNFTGAVEKAIGIPLEGFTEPKNLDTLAYLFHEPEKLRPEVTREAITIQVAKRLGSIANQMRERGLLPHAVARFLDRIVFCLFAEDVELLPNDLFTKLTERAANDPKKFFMLVGQLFRAMADGGNFGLEDIRHFNGSLFDSTAVVQPTVDEILRIKEASRLDWGQVDPSIFGTLFERGMDPGKRAQLGAHYTSREDIETVVEPVVLDPLRREWAEVKQAIDKKLSAKQPQRKSKKERGPAALITDFLTRLQAVTVLDPACGSGNFLYVALQKLKDLEKEVLVYASDKGLGNFFPLVGPWQLYGIEKNQYAFELAQVSIWIGYIQWQRANGYRTFHEPILRKMTTFERKDAILDVDVLGRPIEPSWPEVEFIVGNPPFLGGKKLKTELGDEYVDQLFRVWRERVRPEADLCCYWFEKARQHIEQGKCRRAGLLATQGIRGGANRETLKRIKDTGDIFFAESDRDWVLDGASVHVSMVGFDSGVEKLKVLDGAPVAKINSNLTAESDITQAKRLRANLDISYMGDTKGGKFDIDKPTALELLNSPNPSGKPTSDVLFPWINGLDVTRRNRNNWIVDFGVSMPEPEASLYEAAFEHVREAVHGFRQRNKRETYKQRWWLHVEPRPAMRAAFERLSRFIVTPRVSKFRLFAWASSPTLPDCQLIAFARADDYTFGVLHSRIHEVWGLRLGTRLETRPRYTPTSSFETFPFPQPDDVPREAIAEAARRLDELRCNWLNPPEMVRELIYEFPGSASGPWGRFVHEPDSRGVGTVRFPRVVPKTSDAARLLARRTLTNLYNERPTWLQHAHRALDEAVFSAYGWAPGMSEEQILEGLLALNLSREAAQGAVPSEEETDEADDDANQDD